MITDSSEALEYLARIGDVEQQIAANTRDQAEVDREARRIKGEIKQLVKLRAALLADLIEDRPLFDSHSPEVRADGPAPQARTEAADRNRADGVVAGPEDPGGARDILDRPGLDAGQAGDVEEAHVAPTRVFLVIGKNGQPAYGVRAETRREAENWNHAMHPGDWDLAVVDPEERQPGGKKWLIPPTGFLVFDVAEERLREAAKEAEALVPPKPKKTRKSKAKAAPEPVIEADLEKLLEAESEEDARKEELTEGGGYEPGHPWYYKCGGRVLPVEEIEVATISEESAASSMGKLPKDVKKRRAKLETALEGARRALDTDIARYRELCEKGVDALSEYERGRETERYEHESGSCSLVDEALSLKHNHISYTKGMITAIEKLLLATPELTVKVKPTAVLVSKTGPTTQTLDAIGVPDVPENDDWRLSDIWELNLPDVVQARAEEAADDIGQLFDRLKTWGTSPEEAADSFAIADAITAFRERCHRNRRVAEARRAEDAKPKSKPRVAARRPDAAV